MQNQTKVDALSQRIEQCLAELRAMPQTKRFGARRRFVQMRYCELGRDLRQAMGLDW
jgi:hypothetical protein